MKNPDSKTLLWRAMMQKRLLSLTQGIFGRKNSGIAVIFVMLIVAEMVFYGIIPFCLAADEKITWKLIGPGDADQVTSLSVGEDGAVYAGTDIGGIYYSSNQGESWFPINNGIKNYDITTPVIIDPKDKKKLYVGTRGGFYKSTDGGVTWKSVWKGIGSPQSGSLSACIGSLVLHPEDNRILYLGFGYRPSTEGGPVIKKISWGSDIYMSKDDGETWKSSFSPGFFPDEELKVRHMVIDYKNTNIMYVATNEGLLKSLDAGKTWRNILNTAIRHIATHPNDPRMIYLAAGPEGVFKSENGGESWEKKNSGLHFIKTKSKHTDNYAQILIDKKNTKVMYAINSTWGESGGVYKSVDNGDTWIKVTKWNGPLGGKGNVEIAWLELSRKVNAIALDPRNSERIYIGTSRYIYRSDNGGATWKQLISKEVSPGRWTHRGINVFGHTHVVGIDPKDHNHLYVGTADHGLVISDDNGKSWYASVNGMKYKDDIFDVAVDPKKPNIVHVINAKGLKIAGFATSSDYGNTWVQRTEGLPDNTLFNTILINPYHTEIIFIGGKPGIYKSEDKGISWIKKDTGLPHEIRVQKLAYHPEKKSTLYAATDDGLYKSDDDGNSWVKTHKNSLRIASLAIDSHQPEHLYAGVVRSKNGPGGVYKSSNGGKTWTQILSGPTRIESVAIVPSVPSVIYAASNDHQYHDESSGEGVFRSVNGGKTWENINNGLPVLRAFNINVNPSPPHEVYLSANGSGVYVTGDPAMDFSSYKKGNRE